MNVLGTLFFVYYFTGIGFAAKTQSSAARYGVRNPFPLPVLFKLILGWPYYIWRDFRDGAVQRQFRKARSATDSYAIEFEIEAVPIGKETYATWLSNYLIDLIELAEQRAGPIDPSRMGVQTIRHRSSKGHHKARIVLTPADDLVRESLRWAVNYVEAGQHG